jgi:hypothetical protein
MKWLINRIIVWNAEITLYALVQVLIDNIELEQAFKNAIVVFILFRLFVSFINSNSGSSKPGN